MCCNENPKLSKQVKLTTSCARELIRELRTTAKGHTGTELLCYRATEYKTKFERLVLQYGIRSSKGNKRSASVLFYSVVQLSVASSLKVAKETIKNFFCTSDVSVL